MDAIDIALIYTLTSDEKTQKRIADLAAAQEVYYVAQKKAADDQKNADATLALAIDAQKKADAKVAEAEAVMQTAAKQKQDLDDLIKAHAVDVKALNDEKAAFTSVTQAVDKQQAEKSAALAAAEADLKLRSDVFARESSSKAASLTEQGAEIEKQMLALQKKQEALKAAMGG